MNLIDEIIKEPLGGAHSNHSEMMTRLKLHLTTSLTKLQELSGKDLVTRRFQRIMDYGKFKIEDEA